MGFGEKKGRRRKGIYTLEVNLKASKEGGEGEKKYI